MLKKSKRLLPSRLHHLKHHPNAVLFALFCLFQLVHDTSYAQLSTEEVRPIDSAFVTQWLLSPVFHTLNVHSLPSGDPIMTWDAGNGLYTGIPDYAVAWSHTEKVSADTAAMLNSVNGQSYISFDLNQIQSIEDYADSITNWFASIGIPVTLAEINLERFELFPNPASQKVQLRASAKPGIYSLEIFNVHGWLIETVLMPTSNNTLGYFIDVSHYPNGIYYLYLSDAYLPMKLIVNK